MTTNDQAALDEQTPVDPATNPDTPVEQTENPSPEQLRQQIEAELKAEYEKKLADLDAKVKNKNKEAASRRVSLKSIEEQHEELATSYKNLEAEHATLQQEHEALKTELEGFRSHQNAERDALLKTMKPEHQEKFKHLSLADIRVLHAELYGTTARPTPSQGASKPTTVANATPSLADLLRGS